MTPIPPELLKEDEEGSGSSDGSFKNLEEMILAMKQDVKECKKWMARGTSDDSAKKSKVNTLQSEKREKSKESNEHQNSFKRPKDLPNL